ncbi:hypothetical protein JW964_21255 [candidate division KSB1 bacterium]|nr:hypothetical protein [candidate division KSB1 bacterium]
MQHKTIARLTLAVIITTVIWIILMIITGWDFQPTTTLPEKIAAMHPPGFLHYLTYVNATLITLFTVAMFAGFYNFCNKYAPIAPDLGLIFIPIYGLGNLMVYLSQIFVVPYLLEIYHAPETQKIAEVLLGLMLQNWPGSAMEALNSVSYGVLGISSIIMGTIMIQQPPPLRHGSYLLILSGIFSIIGVIGLGLKISALSMLIVISGVIYLIGLIFIYAHFRKYSPA